MLKLDCVVTNCVYNADKCCCKGDILVEGKDAKKTEETCCGSFKERRGQGTDNVKGAKKEIDVACEACNCIYNEDLKCSADHIGIVGSNACHCGETECASFCCD